MRNLSGSTRLLAAPRRTERTSFSLSRPRFFPWLTIVAWLAWGCSGSSAATRPAAAPEDFPLYQGQAMVLFDDQIDPIAVGLVDATDNPRTDARVKARGQAAEAIARVRVATVSVDSARGQPVYRVNLALLPDGVISRHGLDDDHFEIAVRSESPAFGVVKWLDTRLIGKTFIGFFRRYRSAEDVELRFHLSADVQDMFLAAHEAAALREFSGK